MKMGCVDQKLNWSKSDGAGRHPWKFSLVFHQVCGTFSANYHPVGSLTQNTHGCGFVLHRVCPISLLFGTNSDFSCTLVHNNTVTEERKGLQNGHTLDLAPCFLHDTPHCTVGTTSSLKCGPAVMMIAKQPGTGGTAKCSTEPSQLLHIWACLPGLCYH